MVTVVLVIGQRLLVKAYWFCDSSCRKGKYIMRSLHLSLSHPQPQPVEPQPNVFFVFIS